MYLITLLWLQVKKELEFAVAFQEALHRLFPDGERKTGEHPHNNNNNTQQTQSQTTLVERNHSHHCTATAPPSLFYRKQSVKSNTQDLALKV